MLATENLWRAWSFQPLVIGVGLVAIGFFLHGWLRLHRRKPSLAPWTRIPLFVAGVGHMHMEGAVRSGRAAARAVLGRA